MTSHKCYRNSDIFVKYLTHNLALYIKQKLLKNAIWGRNVKILAKRKVCLKIGKCLPFWFGFRKNDGGEPSQHLVEFLPNIHKIFGHIINYLLTSRLRLY